MPTFTLLLIVCAVHPDSRVHSKKLNHPGEKGTL